MMDVLRLYNSLLRADDSSGVARGRADDVDVHVSGPHYVLLACPGDGPNVRQLVQLAHDLAEMNFSEMTNDDATSVMIQTRYSPANNDYMVAAAVTDWVT